MNCSDARKVWSHPQGFIAGLKEHLPGVFERMDEIVQQAVRGEPNRFLEAVRKKVGDQIKNNFFGIHAEDSDLIAEQVHDVLGDIAARLLLEHFFTNAYGRPVFLGNVCCKGCTVSFERPLTLKEAVVLQHAAVTTGPNGEDLS